MRIRKKMKTSRLPEVNNISDVKKQKQKSTDGLWQCRDRERKSE